MLVIPGYKSSHNYSFRTELEFVLSTIELCNNTYDHFLNFFIEIFNKQAPVKLNVQNVQGFITKDVNKGIMKLSRLCNKFLKEHNVNETIAHKKGFYGGLRKPITLI